MCTCCSSPHGSREQLMAQLLALGWPTPLKCSRVGHPPGAWSRPLRGSQACPGLCSTQTSWTSETVGMTPHQPVHAHSPPHATTAHSSDWCTDSLGPGASSAPAQPVFSLHMNMMGMTESSSSSSSSSIIMLMITVMMGMMGRSRRRTTHHSTLGGQTQME